jgi:outer membrane protein assembly factor BamB
MRLAYAAGVLALATLATGCATAPRQDTDKVLKRTLDALGVEGRSYAMDLSMAASVHVKNVHRAGGDLLLEDIHGHLTYVDGTTLTPKWDYYGLGQPFDVKPDLTPSAIIGLAGGKLYVISRHNGTIDGDPMFVDVIPSAAPVSTDSTLYVPTYATPTGDDTVTAVSLGSGFKGWGVKTNEFVVADMAKGGTQGGDTLYFATANGAIFAYPTKLASEPRPEPAWSAHAYSPIRHNLVVDGDDLGVVTADGRLICYDRVTGNVRWEVYPDSGERAGSRAQFGPNHTFYVCGNELRAFDRETGRRAWSHREADRFLAQRGDRVLVGNGKRIWALNATSGKVISCVNAPGVIIVPDSTADQTVYAVSPTGVIVAVELGW